MSESDTRERAKRWAEASRDGLRRILDPIAEGLVEATGVSEEDFVLDVACGSGSASIAAHRNGGYVTAVDANRALLETARRRVEGSDAEISLLHGNPIDLEFEDDTFDVALSTFGPQFTLDPGTAVTELVRVTKPGGRVAFTVFSGRIAEIFDALTEYHGEAGVHASVASWSDPEFVERYVDGCLADVTVESSDVRVKGPSNRVALERWFEVSVALRRSTRTTSAEDRATLDNDCFADVRQRWYSNGYVLETFTVAGTVR